uniref:DUF541 domain-containing protein n=1 Tax=Thermodesulfobacterium geofontis TaxID=1295609 RepID=A0A7V5XFF0_9BACT
MKNPFLFNLFIFLILISFKLNAQACEKDKTTVFITLEEKKELVPDILSLNLKINVITPKEAEAINIMGGLDKALRNLNLEYKGGKYSVYENCWWEEGKKRCAGYKGSIGYLFLLKDYFEQNKVFEVLDEFKNKYGEKIKFEVHEPEWIVSEKKQQEIEKELKLKIIDRAKEFSETVSKTLDKNCDIESIDYNIEPVYRPYSLAKTIREATIEAPEPKKEEKSVSIRAGIRLICK